MVGAALPAELEALAGRIVLALQQEAAAYSVPGAVPTIELSHAQFSLVTDPANQLAGYTGIWRNARSHRCGMININSDGSFYAEYDVFCPHPRDSRWFVEMVTAWGNATKLRSEATLIPAVPA